MRARRPVGLVLLWHTGLLKLLPFFRIPEARVVLFLHGIEAGLSANPDRPEELAGVLCRLRSDGREWQLWSARAKARYESYFTAALSLLHLQARLHNCANV